MADALRHARLLHYLLIGLSIASLLTLVQRTPLAETYARAQIELDVLQVLLGRVPPGLSQSEFEAGNERTQAARNLIISRGNDHVYHVLSRSLRMGMGGDFDQILVAWEVPIAHESQLPLDSDLLEIRSHFSAIPIVVLQPDLGELAWLLTSRMSAEELAQIRKLRIRMNDAAALEAHIRRSGFISGEEGIQTQIEIDYTTVDGSQNRIESKLNALALRMPDLDQRAAFHASFAELSRVFPLVEFQTPEQANLTLAAKELEARGGLLSALLLSTGARMSLLLAIPLFMLFLLGHVRHLVELLEDGNVAGLRSFPWFPLFRDPNSRTFAIITLMLLPGAGAAAWVAMHFIDPTPLPVEDLLLHAAGFAVPVWIGSTILSDLEELRSVAEEGEGSTAPTGALDDA